MAYHEEKSTGDIVIDGFESGISPSPHKGIANIKNANISTEMGEVMTSYGRVLQSQTSISGTLTYQSTNRLTSSNALLLVGSWISVGAGISGLSAGNYYVISKAGSPFGLTIELSTAYSTNSGDILSGFTSGSATFSVLFTPGQAIQGCTEPYKDSSGNQQYRYYILDTNGRIWLHDTQVYSGLDSPAWSLPYNDASTLTNPKGIGVLNGFLIITDGSHIYTKSTAQLGAAVVLYYDDPATMSLAATQNPQYILVGHQGKAYYTDGNYIGEIFPDTSVLTGVNNVQSYCTYTASTITGTITVVIGGSLPYTYQADGVTIQRVPVVFFPAVSGNQPTYLTAGQVYWLEYQLGAPPTFKVYDIQSGFDTVTTVATPMMGDTSATLTANWPYASGTYSTQFSEASPENKNVVYTAGSTSISWTGGLSANATTKVLSLQVQTPINIATGASGTQYFNTFFPQSASGSTTITFTRQRVNLPFNETATTLAEIGNTVIIGTKSSTIYPWNQIDATPSNIINLPEAGTQQLLTVNQMCYIFAGNKGNVYITDGNLASLVMKVPDYCAGIPGTPLSYFEPYFQWGGVMYLRGRVYFSLLDQTSAKAGQCGGIWSFIPTQNVYVQQDVGAALRQENVSSYGTYNGVSTVLIPDQNQQGVSPLYWSAWYSSISGPTYGFDYTESYPGRPFLASSSGTNFNTIIETDLIPIGTMLKKYTPSQIEYKLATALASTEVVSIGYRLNGTDAYTDMGTAIIESATNFSGYFQANFQNAQWLQLQIVLTPTDTNTPQSSFLRLSEVRIRNQA